MKTYYICAAIFFIAVYAVFHFGFRKGGDGQLYKINESVAFELQTANGNFNGITIRSFRPTNAFVKFICGDCEYDKTGTVEMVNVKYRRGDFVYSDFPQHPIIPIDIINLRTGEAIEASVPTDFKYGDDFAQLPEYKSRRLVKADENKLTQDYVKANFEHLSTFTNRCLYAHLIFAGAALFLAYPKLFVHVIDAFAQANDPTRPENYYRIGDS